MPQHCVRPLSRHLFRRALLPLCIGLATTAPLTVLAQAPVAQQSVVAFDIPAGKLSTALNALARQSGLTLSVDPGLLEGKTVAATKGSLTTQQALDRLLAGSGLRAQASGSAIVVSSGAVSTLQAVRVNAGALGATTEGTGSYTTGVTSSSTGLDLSLRETPQSISVMTRDRMKDQDLTNIGDVMQQMVGISGNNTSALGSDGTQYVSRGFTIDNYMVDGVPRPTSMYGFAEETADMVSYDRIEVVRGASGLMTGVGTPSATINLIRKRPTREFAGSVTAKTGSWDLYRLEADVGGALVDSGRVRGRLAAAWQENDSFIDREHAERQAVYGIAEVDLTDSTLLMAGVEYQDFENEGASRGGLPLLYSDGGRTHFSRSANSGTEWSTFGRDSTNLFFSLDHSFSDAWRLGFNYEHKEGVFDETQGYVFAGSLARDGSGGTMYISRWARDLEIDAFNASLHGAFDLFGRTHELVLMASHAEYRDEGPDYPGWWAPGPYRAAVPDAFALYRSGNWTRPDLSADTSSAGGEIKESALAGALRLRPADAVSVILGVRVSDWEESTWYRSAGSGKSTTPGGEENGVFTPYAGVVVDLTSELSLYASYTSVFKPQSYKDIDGSRLDPLEGDNYELGLKAELLDGRLNASAAVFQMEQKNYPVPLGAGIYAPDGSPAYRAADGAEVEGVELELSGELMPGWQVAGGYAYASGEEEDGTRLVPNVPRDTFKLFSTYQLPGNWSAFTVGGNLAWQGSSTVEDVAVLGGGDYEQGSLVLVDLLAKYQFPRGLTLVAHANNVFDKRYYSGLSQSAARYGTPRNYSLSLRYDF